MRSIFALRGRGGRWGGSRPGSPASRTGWITWRPVLSEGAWENVRAEGYSHEDHVPEVVTRKRVGRRSGGLRFKLNRWFYRNRPAVAVGVAFIIFVLVGIAFAQLSITSSVGHPAEVESGAAL